jgi:hypothetical protein
LNGSYSRGDIDRIHVNDNGNGNAKGKAGYIADAAAAEDARKALDCALHQNLLQSLPDSASKECGIYPVVYLSSNCIYPTTADYGWRASGLDGTCGAVLETDEWKYSQGKCYFSIYGFDLEENKRDSTENPITTSSLPCQLSIWQRLEEDTLDETTNRRYAVFQEVFTTLDGGNVSQRER